MVVTNPISSHATGVTSALLSGGAPSSVLAPGATSAPATTVGFHPLQPVVGTNGARTPMISLLEWAANLGLPAPRRQADSPQPTYEVATALGRALIRIGSTRATIRGVDVMLGHAPQFVSGEPCLHRIDYQKTLNPLLWPIEPRWGSTNRLIVIDAGHGGRDAGTESVDRRFYERKVTLDWALRLKAILESQGYRVAMTRTNETDLSLAERVFFAESLKADLFVSLHFNSAYPVNNKRGLETYVLTPPGLASSVIREGDDNPRLSFPNNAFDLENLNLAWQIQKSVVARTGAVDRGVQRARWLGVLRGQSRPAILVEGGYLSNAEEARKIGDPGYRQRLAEGVAAGLNALASPSVIESTMTSDNDLPPNRTLN